MLTREQNVLSQAEETCVLGEVSFRLIADTSPVALIISRASDGCIRYANKQASTLFRRKNFELLNCCITELFKKYSNDAAVISILSASHEVKNHELYFRTYSEPAKWLSLSTRTLMLEGERVICSALIDVTEAHELSTQLSLQARFDDLTGLVNRREFESRLQEVIETAGRSKTENVLLYLDLDQFKVINETCGHIAGDELLRQLSRILHPCVRRDGTLARLGEDEFGVLLERCAIENAIVTAENLRQAAQDFRFTWEGSIFNIGVSIGLTPISQEGDTITDALRRADTACCAAKEAGRNRVHVLHSDDKKLLERHGEMKLLSSISSALDEGRMELWQQAISHVDCLDEVLDRGNTHFELLLRMRNRDGSIVGPNDFLPSAERYDLATRIDRWVLDALFNWFSLFPDQCDRMSLCSVNLSGQSLSDEKFLQEIVQQFRESKIPAKKVCFEITETAAILNLDNARQFILALKKLGCTFALDDFGSGLSSFAYLKTLPVDFVKIDGFFVRDIVKDSVDHAMVKAINDMAHAMDKQTIAEFVEDREILEMLVDLGVDYVQGYGIAQPVPLIHEPERKATSHKPKATS